MKIAVTGKTGQVALALSERASGAERAGSGAEVALLGRPELDLAAPASIAAAIAAVRPDVVVNAAAYTAVDQAETQRDTAFAVNGAGAGAVAAAAWALGVPLIHISTDYVFDGGKPAPYAEGDATAPLGVYGASKLAGEAAVLAAHPAAVILRTAWVYSPFGGNFVKTMLRLAATRDDSNVPREIRVVADQIGNPTSALDIADGVLALAQRLVAAPAAAAGVFHMAGSGEASWADLAVAVFAASAAQGGPAAKVHRISTADYPTPAPRPANSRLNCAKLAQAYGLRLPDWRASVTEVVARLIKEHNA